MYNPSFSGFAQPRDNYYRLPNAWFDIWAWVRDRLNTSRLDGPIKWLEFLIKHSWGYLNFNTPVKLTTDEFADGRRRATRDGSRGSRMDRGTGLSSRTLVSVPRRLLDLGIIERYVDDADSARVRLWYLPRLRPDHHPADSDFQSLTTFGGFSSLDSNYFPIPFVWTDLCHDISSGVAILAAEYLMRHTFGWRDPVRWLTPTEIATGRQRLDATTYDDGIRYPRDTVAAACDYLVDVGILVWRPAERTIGRESSQYALRMQSMVLDEPSGRWLGWAGEESGPDSEQSKTLTRQSKALTGQSTTLTRQSKTLTGQSTTRSDNNTYTQHIITTPATTPTTTPVPPHGHENDADAPVDDDLVVVAAAVAFEDAPRDAPGGALEQALADVGITGKKRADILALDDAPLPSEVYGWAYWAHAQAWADRNPIGAAINHLLNPHTRHDPPTPFLDFGRDHGSTTHTARVLRAAYGQSGRPIPHTPDAWDETFGPGLPDDLPLPHPAAARLWDRERRVLETGLDAPPDDDARHRWSEAWQAVVPATADLAEIEHRPLGYADDRLVVLVRPIEMRVAVELHRADLEASLGQPIQFTALDLAPPGEDAPDPHPPPPRLPATRHERG